MLSQTSTPPLFFPRSASPELERARVICPLNLLRFFKVFLQYLVAY